MLADPHRIRRAAEICIRAGVDFLKTSTGKAAVGATPEAARVMLETIRASGRPVGFKVSGGVRTVADALGYVGLAEDIFGADWIRPERFRIGASGLMDVLLAAVGEDSD
jgi:deoxyribose-phosphate aldolase